MINLKSEKGSITVMVTATILFFVIILSATYMINANLRKSQIKSEAKLKETYEGEFNNVDKIYADMFIKISDAKASGNVLSYTGNEKAVDDNGKFVTIPAGFKVASDSATDENYGVVIEDATGNQFVWIPVEDSTSLYQTIPSTALRGTTVYTTKSSKSGIISGKTRGITGSSDFREPDILSDATYGDSATQYSTVNYTKAGFTSLEEMATAMRDDYEAMIESVNTNKGFYVGRYELTGSVANPTEKAGATLTYQNWYNLYKACKAVKNTSYAQTSMIWGCQWDTVCNFIANSGDKKSITDSSSWGNYNGTSVKASDGTTEIKASGTNNKLNTGVTTFTEANNIYDIAGNCWEWTQEASYTDGRVNRGGSFDYSGSDYPASYRNNSGPSNSNHIISSRVTLYIK